MLCRNVLKLYFTTIALRWARKDHECDYCKGVIKKGSRYLVVKGLNSTRYYHIDCFNQDYNGIVVLDTGRGLQLCIPYV